MVALEVYFVCADFNAAGSVKAMRELDVEEDLFRRLSPLNSRSDAA